MVSAVLMALICKERETQEYMRAALSDSLTGIANHGTLLDSARRLFARCRKDATPFSLIMFDLDHFKIDQRPPRPPHRRRHPARLRRDGAWPVAPHRPLRPLRRRGVHGRPSRRRASKRRQVIAERVRHAFADTIASWAAGRSTRPSAPALPRPAQTMSLEDTLDAADRAMYRAKHLGRNRVERAGAPPPGRRQQHHPDRLTAAAASR